MARPLPLLAGRYRIGSRLGGGAVGEVYEAVDLRTGASVAVKRIPLGADIPSAERAEWLARLHREADISRRLEHPDILAVHEAGLTAHEAWLAMERVHGNDLSRYTQPSRLLPETLVLRIGARVGAALAHAHARGIVHRDLKPANVVVDLGTGVLKLIDFGVARVDDAAQTRTGMTLGTPAYMAPEQLAGAPASAATDTYALGVMLFELLAGRRPHQADTLGELLRSTHREAPARLAVLRRDLPATVVASVESLLAREPEQRPTDLADWAANLAALAAVMARVLAPDVAFRL
ncbi:serine/threonine-protein kinase [Ideonella sp. DXS22W]|uniref:Serine/threonine-protein kinase n=1 Tax=Pseudaquabacterium inlustre TaxID=2984192 RepID=A0ABU9CM68_9BURK